MYQGKSVKFQVKLIFEAFLDLLRRQFILLQQSQKRTPLIILGQFDWLTMPCKTRSRAVVFIACLTQKTHQNGRKLRLLHTIVICENGTKQTANQRNMNEKPQLPVVVRVIEILNLHNRPHFNDIMEGPSKQPILKSITILTDTGATNSQRF